MATDKLVFATSPDTPIPRGGQLRLAYCPEPHYVVQELVKILPTSLSIATFNVSNTEEAARIVVTGRLAFCITDTEAAQRHSLEIRHYFDHDRAF